MEVHAYLTFPGTCAQAVLFYKQTLGAEIVASHSFRGTPAAEGLAAEHLDRIMHTSFKIGPTLLMASDTMPGHPYDGMKGVSLSINTKDPGEAERVFRALAEGGQVTMPLGDQFWGAKFGMLVDKFGIAWMVNCDLPKPS
ncbi:MAG: VOC family protein [Myxococcales bacterium]|nr:VOC family protein [Myxococcales bacterium]